MKIADVDVGEGVIAAPLAGFTDAAQRQLSAEYGADLTVTEMVSAKGLLMRSDETRKLLLTSEAERPVTVQLFGADPFAMKDAASHPLLQKFDLIDLNMGCPVPKVTKTGAGSALMRTIDRAATLVRVAKEGSKKPVTVKFRLGFDDTQLNYLEFGAAMRDAGADAVTLHARTRAQGYAGSADWTAIARLRESLDIPVVANGDVVDRASYEACKRATGCDMVMIGRAATGCPWIFDTVKGREPAIELSAFVRRHYRLLTEFYDERYAVLTMRKLLGHYLRGVPGASRARGELNRADTIEEAFAVLDGIFCEERE